MLNHEETITLIRQAKTGDERAKEIALEIYEDTLRRLEIPHEIKVAPYVIPEGMKTHGVNMIFSFFYYT